MDLTLVILTWYLNHFIFLCPNQGPKPLSVSLIFKEAFHVSTQGSLIGPVIINQYTDYKKKKFPQNVFYPVRKQVLFRIVINFDQRLVQWYKSRKNDSCIKGNMKIRQMTNKFPQL